MHNAKMNDAASSTNKFFVLNRWCHIIDNIYHCFASAFQTAFAACQYLQWHNHVFIANTSPVVGD